MSKVSETGHVRNISNFESLLSFVSAFGANYNPSRESIKLPALQSKLTASRASLDAVYSAQSAYSLTVDDRKLAFKTLNKLVTRVISALKSTETPKLVNESAQSIVRKLRGARAKAKITEEEKEALLAEGKEVNQRSSSQLGYDSRIENFNRLISLLSSIPHYAPNETDLKVESLMVKYESMNAKNIAVVNALVHLDIARNLRNELLYKPLSGIVALAADTKLYFKSVLGSSDPLFKQLTRLKFTSA